MSKFFPAIPVFSIPKKCKISEAYFLSLSFDTSGRLSYLIKRDSHLCFLSSEIFSDSKTDLAHNIQLS
jgi:hypothetical protein